MGRGRKKKQRAIDRGWNYHHRKPKSMNGSGDLTSGNMIRVEVNKHRAWHLLFDTVTPQEICNRINSIWGDPEYEFIARKRRK